MDDLADEAILNEMTEAPTVAVNRVATYKELTSDLLRHAAFASLEDIDLSILARCLQSEAVLHEPDEVWTWEKLFTEVTAEIHADKPRSADSSYWTNMKKIRIVFIFMWTRIFSCNIRLFLRKKSIAWSKSNELHVKTFFERPLHSCTCT